MEEALPSVFDELPIDPYAPGSGRYRRYGRMVFQAWNERLDWLPDVWTDRGAVAPYDQGEYNSEFPVTRYLPGLGKTAELTDGLGLLVRSDLALLPAEEAFTHWPVYVGVHLIRLCVLPGQVKAFVTPNHLHQDGGSHMHTFVHLVGLQNAAGGEILVAAPHHAGRLPTEVTDAERLAEFCLAVPGEGYAVQDQAVSHHVEGIEALDKARAAVRDIILVGISPYQPAFFC